MTEINTSEIFNEVNKKYFRLYVEWCDSCFKVMLLESTITPLSGEMNAEDIDYFCDQLSVSSNEYIQETKEILCGKNKEIHFAIQDTVFEWKKGAWIRGRVKLYPVLDIKVISETFQRSLKFYQDIQEKANKLEEENKSLTDIKDKLTSDIEKMIEIKTAMEQDLYKKFILILNSKKKKLRELENMIKEKQNTKESIFDARTDESEESEEENKTSNTRVKPIIPKKRKFTANSSSEITQNSRRKTTTNTKCVVDDESTHKLSTNNVDSREQQSCASGSRQSRSSLNFTEESEEELFSD